MQGNLKTPRYVAVVLLCAGFFVAGVFMGVNHRTSIEKVVGITGKETAVETTADFSPFWDVWNLINKKYPGASAVSDQERVYGAIAGLVGSLEDPYSVFFEPDDAKSFKDEISGSFSGVGMDVGIKDKVLTVISPLKGTPADKAGIKSGDKILKIGETITADLTIDKAIKLIRGEKGTTVTLTILREGEKAPRVISMVRDIINVPTLDTELRSDGVFVIKLYSFSANSMSLFKKALIEFQAAKTDKLLLDLRGNPGGYLDAAVDIASWFLPSSKVIVTEDYGNDKEPTIFRSKGYDVFTNNLRLVVLMNGGSASASEIVAGALQDHKRALLVGEQSYGKGSVQEVAKVTTDTLLKITVAKWLTPNGTSISLKGLTPDYKVELTAKDREENKDPQLDKAVELLIKWPGFKQE